MPDPAEPTALRESYDISLEEAGPGGALADATRPGLPGIRTLVPPPRAQGAAVRACSKWGLVRQPRFSYVLTRVSGSVLRRWYLQAFLR